MSAEESHTIEMASSLLEMFHSLPSTSSSDSVANPPEERIYDDDSDFEAGELDESEDFSEEEDYDNDDDDDSGSNDTNDDDDDDNNEKEKEMKRPNPKTIDFSTYIYKVLKSVHPEMGISRKAMCIMNTFLNDCMERIAVEAGNLVRYNRNAILSPREIQTAVRLILPDDLAKHAVSEGVRTVTKFQFSHQPDIPNDE